MPRTTKHRFNLDIRAPKPIHINASLKGFDWTVKNPVPTLDSVFGVMSAPTIKIPEFKL